MLKETETEETIGFVVIFLSLVAFQLGGGPVAYAGFSKGGEGARKFRKFEKNKDQNENFSSQNQSFLLSKKDQKKDQKRPWPNAPP